MVFNHRSLLILRNLKISQNSENSGLENIQKRYKLLIQKSIETKLESNSFTVKVPILKLE